MKTKAYREMTVEYLGSEATESDLEEFIAACERRQDITGETDQDVTEWMWGNGDYLSRVRGWTPEHEPED